MRGVAPRRKVTAPSSPAPQRVRVCGYRTCHTLILSLPGTTPTNRCTEHTGMENEPETNESFVARVCRELGWRRAR